MHDFTSPHLACLLGGATTRGGGVATFLLACVHKAIQVPPPTHNICHGKLLHYSIWDLEFPCACTLDNTEDVKKQASTVTDVLTNALCALSEYKRSAK